MKDRSLIVAALIGALSGTLVGAGTFYYAQLSNFSVQSPYAVDQEMSLRNYLQGEYEIRTKRQVHGDDQRRRPSVHNAAPTVNPLTKRCEGLSGSRFTKCVGNAQEGIRYERD